MKRKMLSAVLVLIAATASVAACGSGGGEGSEPDTREPGTHYTFWQDLPAEAGGGRVLCVWAKSGYGGGLSCDWQGRRQ
jgi:hypothetical protein